MEDAETGEQLFLDTHDRGFRRRFAASAAARWEALGALCARTGVGLLSLSTEGDLARDIMRFAAERRQRRAMPHAAPGGRRQAG